MTTLVLSLGGSLIVPDKIDVKFLKNFKKTILNFTAKKNKVIIICGGGKTCRIYQNECKKISTTSNKELDLLGIKATMLNAQLVKAIFGDKAILIGDPEKKIKTNKKIIIGAGWLPGYSSDMDAVLVAKNFKAKTLINLSNVQYIYNKDPNKFKDAKKIKQTTWKNFQKIVGTKWIPGKNTPFDPIATKLATKLKLKLLFMNGDITNFNNFLNHQNRRFSGCRKSQEISKQNKPFKGSIVN